MPGVECSRKMIHASRYQGTTIDHDVPITSCVSRVPRVRRSATGSTPAMGTRNGTRCFPGTRSCSSSPSSPSFSFLSRFLSPSLFFARQFLLRFFFSDEVFCGSHDAATSTCRETKHRKSKTLCNFRARRLKLWLAIVVGRKRCSRQREREREGEFREIAGKVVNRKCWMHERVFVYNETKLWNRVASGFSGSWMVLKRGERERESYEEFKVGMFNFCVPASLSLSFSFFFFFSFPIC